VVAQKLVFHAISISVIFDDASFGVSMILANKRAVSSIRADQRQRGMTSEVRCRCVLSAPVFSPDFCNWRWHIHFQNFLLLGGIGGML
jgi:hypothetical protein